VTEVAEDIRPADEFDRAELTVRIEIPDTRKSRARARIELAGDTGDVLAWFVALLEDERTAQLIRQARRMFSVLGSDP